MRDADVFLEVLGFHGADDGCVAVGMGQGEAQEKGRAALALVEQFVEFRFFELLPAVLAAETLAGLALGDAAADDDARSRLAGFGDQILVLAFEG